MSINALDSRQAFNRPQYAYESVSRERCWEIIETCFNIVGYIPTIAPVSGSMRFSFGTCQAIMGASSAIFSGVFDPDSDPQGARNLAACKQNLEQMYHGLANMFRGSLEMTPVVHPLIRAVYDLSGLRLEYTENNS